MGSLVFNKEDKENIKKSIGLIMDDIRCMWETSQVDRIRIDLNFTNERFSSNNLSLEITDKKIGIHETWYEDHKYFQFERKIGKKSVKKVSNYQLAFNFIKNYICNNLPCRYYLAGLGAYRYCHLTVGRKFA